MFPSSPNFRRVLIVLGVLLAIPASAGLVDFSEGLLNYVSRRFSPDAPKRLFIWQKLENDMRSAEAVGARQSDARSEAQTMRKINDFFNQVPLGALPTRLSRANRRFMSMRPQRSGDESCSRPKLLRGALGN